MSQNQDPTVCDRRVAEVDEHIQCYFDVRKRLGKGAYGIVWKAIDRRTRRIIALKKIFDAFRDETDAQRTYREIIFLRAFRNHPNIIRMLDIYKASNNLDFYLVFEYMDSDLHNVIKKGDILKDIHKRFIMYQLLNAVKYMHSGNVIHRDLKPSNILIDNRCRLKVADFGLARSISYKRVKYDTGDIHDELDSDLMLTDYVATRWYRAPEILVASKNYTKGIDMWSLGCILGEMLRTKPLFQGTSTVNQIEKIIIALPEVTSHDIHAIGASFGTVLLSKKVSRDRRNTLDSMLHHCSADAVALVKALLIFDPQARLTAKEALKHEYVQRFRAESSEMVVNHDITPPVPDDVRATVNEYRSKLYDMIDNPSLSARAERDTGIKSLARHKNRYQCSETRASGGGDETHNDDNNDVHGKSIQLSYNKNCFNNAKNEVTQPAAGDSILTTERCRQSENLCSINFKTTHMRYSKSARTEDSTISNFSNKSFTTNNTTISTDSNDLMLSLGNLNDSVSSIDESLITKYSITEEPSTKSHEDQIKALDTRTYSSRIKITDKDILNKKDNEELTAIKSFACIEIETKRNQPRHCAEQLHNPSFNKELAAVVALSQGRETVCKTAKNHFYNDFEGGCYSLIGPKQWKSTKKYENSSINKNICRCEMTVEFRNSNYQKLLSREYNFHMRSSKGREQEIMESMNETIKANHVEDIKSSRKEYGTKKHNQASTEQSSNTTTNELLKQNATNQKYKVQQKNIRASNPTDWYRRTYFTYPKQTKNNQTPPMSQNNKISNKWYNQFKHRMQAKYSQPIIQTDLNYAQRQKQDVENLTKTKFLRLQKQSKFEQLERSTEKKHQMHLQKQQEIELRRVKTAMEREESEMHRQAIQATKKMRRQLNAFKADGGGADMRILTQQQITKNTDQQATTTKYPHQEKRSLDQKLKKEYDNRIEMQPSCYQMRITNLETEVEKCKRALVDYVQDNRECLTEEKVRYHYERLKTKEKRKKHTSTTAPQMPALFQNNVELIKKHPAPPDKRNHSKYIHPSLASVASVPATFGGGYTRDPFFRKLTNSEVSKYQHFRQHQEIMDRQKLDNYMERVDGPYVFNVHNLYCEHNKRQEQQQQQHQHSRLKNAIDDVYIKPGIHSIDNLFLHNPDFMYGQQKQKYQQICIPEKRYNFLYTRTATPESASVPASIPLHLPVHISVPKSTVPMPASSKTKTTTSKIKTKRQQEQHQQDQSRRICPRHPHKYQQQQQGSENFSKQNEAFHGHSSRQESLKHPEQQPKETHTHLSPPTLLLLSRQKKFHLSKKTAATAAVTTATTTSAIATLSSVVPQNKQQQYNDSNHGSSKNHPPMSRHQNYQANRG